MANNRNGKQKEFCCRTCKERFWNAQRLKGAAMLKANTTTVQHQMKPGKRRVDLEVIPAALRPGLLLEAARRLGITEEGPLLKQARAAGLLAQEISA